MSQSHSGRILIDVLAGLVAVGAGLYLIGTQSAASDSIFNPLLHGMGAYFVARGIWMFSHVGLAARAADR